MSDLEYVITSSAEADPKDVEQVHKGLLAYNEGHAGPAGFRKVRLFARDIRRREGWIEGKARVGVAVR